MCHHLDKRIAAVIGVGPIAVLVIVYHLVLFRVAAGVNNVVWHTTMMLARLAKVSLTRRTRRMRMAS